MPSYLTTTDVAARLGVSLDTVRRWLRSGELKGAPFGRAGYRIEDADFQAFLNRRRGNPAEPSTSLAFSPVQPPVSTITIEEMMNAISQEMRGPLTTTQGILQQARRLLQRALESPLPADAGELLLRLQDLLRLAERQMSAEMRLAGNLLDASRIETNAFKLSLTWCNLVEIVRETVINHQELVPQRLFEQEFLVDDLVAVMADAERIRQALGNYLTNAHKFSPADQSIKINLSVKDAQAQVSVRDQGAGIPASEQSRIWERFQQSQDQPGQSGSGMGLGLYITRAIIQQHGGKVGVISSPGEGSTFWFTLPLADVT